MTAPLPLPVGDRQAVQALLSRLKDQRLARNWSQAEMARRAGMSRAAYQDFESGVGNPTLESVMRVLGVLGFGGRVASLIPPVEIPQTLASVEHPKPRRLRAGSARLRKAP
jgi:transcriptional regulator with XRE-family HTH domain